jgi:3-methyladenine DNA glycosylase AlkD
VALRLIGHVVRDEDPSVRKAIGWAMREVSEVAEPAAFAFLERHRAALAPAVLRESAEKLTGEHRRALGLGG